MDAKSLRIGNVTDKGVVKSFYESGVHVGNGKCFNFTELSPVSLTCETLKHLGFDDVTSGKEDHFVKENFHWYSTIGCISVEFDDGINSYDLTTNCKNVHELQNLYFALTGKEL